MRNFPLKLAKRLQKRKDSNSFRELSTRSTGVDFFSNDYLGFSKSQAIYEDSLVIISEFEDINGATGSRLLSGNHPLFEKAENILAHFHHSEAALIFNSGFDANIGLFSSVPQKGDFLFYDEFSHASIREGLKLSHAKTYKFRHNDIQDLIFKLEKLKDKDAAVYVITESVFSMDGDSPDLQKLVALSEEMNFRLIIDEAHATGVFGKSGKGLLQQLGLQEKVFARVHTFGKAIGCHGAVVLGSIELKDYLVNFARSFIYTTALSPHSMATVISVYKQLEKDQNTLQELKSNINHFRAEIAKNGLKQKFIESESAIQSCIVSGNDEVKRIAEKLQKKKFVVKPILSPTVPAGEERLRFCIHSYNSFEEISQVLKVLGNFVNK